jgi:hypothetical protein
MRLILLTTLAAIFVTGCNDWQKNGYESKISQSGEIDQASLCQVSDISALFGPLPCEPGQKVVFLPDMFGNQQIPVIFAAKHCDLRYSVALTVGGVSCIYMPSQSNQSNSVSGNDTENTVK